MRHKLLIFTLCICSFLSCKKYDFEIENLNGNKITVLGHGGMGSRHTFPLNCFESIYYSLGLASDGVEMDMQMTLDSVMVAMHDRDLSQLTDVSGEMSSLNWEQIEGATYSDPLYTNYRISSSEQVLEGIAYEFDKKIYLDLKSYTPHISETERKRYCNALLRLIDKYNIENRVMVEIDNAELIMTLKSMRPAVSIFVRSDFENALELSNIYDLNGISIAVDKITAEQVAKAHAQGRMVAVYDAETEAKNIEAIEKSVDIIIADKLKHLIRILK